MDEQQLQQQIVLLVQAAMSGDQQANQLIQQIMQAAQQGDQLAMQIAQMILQVAQTMQLQQVQAARFGAKLNYIRLLNGTCPEGYQLQYFKEGGSLCKRCIKVHQEGGQAPLNLIEQFQIESAKCGKKMKKKACGGPVKKEACGSKIEKAACGNKVEKQACGGKSKKVKKHEEGDQLMPQRSSVDVNSFPTWSGDIPESQRRMGSLYRTERVTGPDVLISRYPDDAGTLGWGVLVRPLTRNNYNPLSSITESPQQQNKYGLFTPR